jgi:hypothetical protein
MLTVAEALEALKDALFDVAGHGAECPRAQ